MSCDLSIIIPVYNVEDYLERCFFSVVNACPDSSEIILVDDGSTDSSGGICDRLKDLDPRVKILHKENGGLSSARNEGVKISSGNYIAFVDSDDWVFPKSYFQMLDKIKTENADVLFFDYLKTSSEVNIKQKRIKVKKLSKEKALQIFFNRSLGENNNFPAWNKIFKRELVLQVPFSDGALYEDMFFSSRIFNLSTKVIYFNQISYFYFQKNLSITRSKITKKNLDLISETLKICDLFKNTKYQYKAEKILYKSYFSLLAKIFSTKDYPDDIYTMELLKFWIKELRKHYFSMMFSKMDLKRKLVYNLFTINFFFFRKLFLNFKSN